MTGLWRWLSPHPRAEYLRDWTHRRGERAEEWTERYLLGSCGPVHRVPAWKVDRDRRAAAMGQPRVVVLHTYRRKDAHAS